MCSASAHTLHSGRLRLKKSHIWLGKGEKTWKNIFPLKEIKKSYFFVKIGKKKFGCAEPEPPEGGGGPNIGPAPWGVNVDRVLTQNQMLDKIFIFSK